MKLFFSTLFIVVSVCTFGQDHDHNNWCGFDYHTEQMFAEHPELRQEAIERRLRFREQGINFQDRSGSITIPVVVHILHDNEIGNISDEQVKDGLRILNEDFNRQNPDTSSTRNTANAPFEPVAADMEICFVLAKIDPQGNCTNGIERRNSPAGSYDASNSNTKFYNGGGLSIWDRSRYFNIWIVNSIESGGGAGTTLGYGQFPDFGSASTYGLVIRHDNFGSIGTADGNTQRTLTHEVGHCVGLWHTFQNGCGGNGSNCEAQGDQCCDTPPVDQAHWSCNSSQNNCSQVPNNDYYGTDVYDQFENFMSYSPCQNMFTLDQKEIVLGFFSSLGYLINLHSTNNLTVSTGVLTPGTLCEAEFSANKRVVCLGETITFTDDSFNNVSSRNWTFSGGSPAVSSDSTVSITYNSPGLYEVSLQVSDGNATQTETKTNFISVLADPGLNLPILEDFENTTFDDGINFFTTEDYSTGNPHWKLNNSVSIHGGTKSVYFDNFNYSNEPKASFQSGTIDLSGLDSDEELLLTFDYAYNKRESSNDEWLRVLVSDDCGETWSIRKTIHGGNLSEDVSTTSYVPTSNDEWKHVEVTSINENYHISNFMYKFEFISDNGNNIYIDNINIYPESWLGVNGEVPLNADVNIYPNPVESILNISIETEALTQSNIEIFDVSGKRIAVINQGLNNSQKIEYSTETLAEGVYYLKVTMNNSSVVKKFIKQ